jgi:hypothetical protein
MDVQCQIRITPGTELLRLEALARARKPITGEYTLSVSKHSSAGTSQNLQSGAFSLPSDKQQVLTTLFLEKAAQGHFTATLWLEWNQGKVSCSLP